jgi:hypothetical protein
VTPGVPIRSRRAAKWVRGAEVRPPYVPAETLPSPGRPLPRSPVNQAFMFAFLRPHAVSLVRHAAAAAILAATLAFPLRAQAPASGAAGQVVDAATGAPVSEALIEIEGSPHRVWTDAAGRFTLSLPAGQYRALIRHPGYLPTSEGWWVGDGLLTLTVGLEKRDIILDPILANSRVGDYDLPTRIALAEGDGGGAPKVWHEEELRQAPSMNVADFLLDRLSLVRVPCRSDAQGTRVDDVHECVRIRGQARRVCVSMDESALPGGLSVLANYRPRDLARVMAFRGGEFVMIYTKDFAYHAKGRHWRPVSPTAQMNAYCRRS